MGHIHVDSVLLVIPVSITECPFRAVLLGDIAPFGIEPLPQIARGRFVEILSGLCRHLSSGYRYIETSVALGVFFILLRKFSLAITQCHSREMTLAPVINI